MFIQFNWGRSFLLNRFKYFLILILIFICSSSAFAQYVPGVNNNVTMLANLDEYSVYSNIWGYIDPSGNEYALIGHDAGTSIINITDPANPVEVTMIPGPTAPGTIWREIQTYQQYAYVVSEHTSPIDLTGIQIIDLSGLPDSAVLIKRYIWPGVDSTNARAHTVSVDGQGYLYIQGGTATLGGVVQNGIRIFDISDPVNPLPLSTYDTKYVHDVFIQDSILFASNIFTPPGTIDILNIADRSNPQLITTLTYAGLMAHNSWTTPDRNYLVSSDESAGQTIKIWDISVLWDNDPNNNDEIVLVGEYISDTTQIAHEPRIMGDYAFISHYVEGVRILDISDPSDPVEVGYYDTFQGTGGVFDGDWGVYPFFPSRNFVVSDIQTGLYIFRFDSVSAGGIEGVITNKQSGLPEPDVELYFIEAGKTILNSSDGSYSFRTNEGDHTIVLSKFGFISDTFSVTLPSGTNIVQNFTIGENLAQLSLSFDSISVNLPVDSMLTEQLIISNSGPSGVLEYTLDDVSGPFEFLRGYKKNFYTRKNWNDLKININTSNISDIHISKSINTVQGLGDTIIIDPAGDLIFGTGGDMTGVFATKDISSVTIEFQFLNNVDLDSTFIIFSLDTDFDPNTGAFPGGFGLNLPEQNIGSEYDIIVDVPGLFTFPPQPLMYYIFEGTNKNPSGNPVAIGSISVNADIISLTIPLSSIEDDGNMAIAGFGGHFDAGAGGPTSIDYIPDVGHGTIGVNPFSDLPWLSLSSMEGSLNSGEADTIEVTFDTNGLEKNQTYNGFIAVTTNVAGNEFVTIPVSLFTGPPVSVDEEELVPIGFELMQNYPNPFNPSTIIKYSVPENGFVKLSVYNLVGEEVSVLVNQEVDAGFYEVTFNAANLSSGIYFYRLQAGNTIQIKKMVLLK
ncbi:MAG: choice-of-anchor B family protein [Bacteroidetes bacterium]|nr:choice-of-anchor B family protein [Bacteroidota bacterium]